jgi:septal ring-binding cell division protein DamX
MDKQKIFWVILSVTVFVVVVLVVGVFLLKKEPTGIAASPTTPSTTSGAGLYEFGREAGAAEGDTEVLRFVIGGDGTATDGTATGAAADGTAMDGTAAGGAGVDGEGAYGTELPAAAPTSTAPTASAAKPAATTAKPAAAAPATTTAKPSSAVAAKPAAPTVQYWIQTGSYKSQTRAEELSQTLAVKGLAGRVFSFSQSDATWFRVRIGPYANRQEAEKFLAIVRKIQGLESSFISQVSGTRTAN